MILIPLLLLSVIYSIIIYAIIDEIIAVDLNYLKPTHEEEMKSDDVIYIFPSEPLGSFFSFNKQEIQQNQIIGYKDAMTTLLLKKYDIIKIENRSALMYCFKAERANRLSFFIKSCIKK